MEIIIIMLGESHHLTVNPQDTVISLKQLIQSELRVPIQKQKPVFVGAQRIPLNDDSKLLSWYGVKSGSQVYLLVIEPPPVQVAQLPPVQVTQPPPVQVFLKNEKGQSSTYDIKPNETVDNFKARVEKREGVPVSQQRLLHQSREMTTGRLSDYNVTNQSTIHLMLRLRGG